MASEANNDPAPVLPLPGGDLGIWIAAAVATAVVQGGLYFGIEWLQPGKDHGQFQGQVVAMLAPVWLLIITAIKSHANGNQGKRIEKKQDVAVKVAVETKQDLGEKLAETAGKIEENTNITKAVPEKVAETLAAGSVELQHPKSNLFRPGRP